MLKQGKNIYAIETDNPLLGEFIAEKGSK
uniref:Uncharacterized protein n=1 Tax=Rhizophora mucronata TaxID=61149 RepID=A0A2P2R1R4_RHIMU